MNIALYTFWVLIVASTVVGSNNYSHIFSSFLFESSQMHKVYQTFNISYNFPLGRVVDTVCSTFPLWSRADCSLCVQNIHSYYINVAMQEAVDVLPENRMDNSIIFLQKYYDSLLDAHGDTFTICMFGDFSYHVLYSMLAIVPARVRLFTENRLMNEYDSEGSQLYSLLQKFPDRLDVSINSLDQFLNNVNSIRFRSGLSFKNACDVLHFRGASAGLTKAIQSVQQVYAPKWGTVPVIWERYGWDDVYTMEAPVHWLMRGPWYSGISTLSENQLELRCGIAKLQHVYTPTTVWLGSADMKPVSQSSQDVCTTGEVYFLVTHTEFIFLETALGVRDALIRIGVKADLIEVPALLNVTVAMELLNSGKKVVQIAVGPHQPTLLLQHYLLFHTENFECVFIDLPRYKVIMQGALGVFVYSSVHKKFVEEKYAIPTEKVFVIPFYSHSPYLEEALTEPKIEKYNQVYYYGTNSERRNEFEYEIAAYFLSRNISYLSTQIMRVYIPELDPYDGRTKEWLIKNSRVIVSLHSGPPENRIVLETHRINHLLSFGKIVVTEPSYDPELDAMYADTIIFAHKDDINRVVEELLRDERRMVQLEAKARSKYEEVSNNVTTFRLAIDQALKAAWGCG